MVISKSDDKAIGSVAAEVLNHFRLRDPRRITVQLGDLDAVFEPVAGVHGKKQRLQALGYYYEPFTAATGNNVTEAYTNCAAAWRTSREATLGAPFASNAAFENDMQGQIRRFVVQGGAIPARGGDVRLYVPGALTFSAEAELGDGGVADGHPLPSTRFTDEGVMWTGNTALGRIPIVFKVERQVNGSWRPSPNEWIHFQLIPPYYDNPAHELDDVNALRNTGQRPALWGYPGGVAEPNGIRQFITAAINNNFNTADPQRYNAHQNRGGKRGLPLLGNIFDPLPATGFPGMNAPLASGRLNSVRVQSNATGDGGVLFMPSRMGGDRYRIRIFLDPNAGFASDGTERGAVVFETGRFTVWKHILWSTYLPKPAPNFPALASVRGVQSRLAVLGYDTGTIDGNDGPLTRGAVRAFQRNHHQPQNGHWNHTGTQGALNTTVAQYISGGGSGYTGGFGPNVAPFRFATAIAQFQSMYCELQINPAITATPPPQLTAAQYRDAIRWAITQVQANQGTLGLSARRNVSAMFSDEFETPFLFEIQHPRQYNRKRGAGFPAAVATNNFRLYWLDATSCIYGGNVPGSDGLLNLFLRYVTGQASAANPPTANLTRYSTPGIAVVAAMAASRMFSWPKELRQVMPPSIRVCRASGIATKERAASVFGGVNYYATWVYLGDGYTKNALHEIGHTLFLRHQFTATNWLHHANFREDHDSLTTVSNPETVPAPVPYDRCLMGYLPCDGDYCGKCHLKIRGWDISQMPV